MIDRAAIEAAWNRIAHMLDPVHGDAEADMLLRNRAFEQEAIDHAVAHIDLINRADIGAIDALDYGFARDPLVWRRGSEAVYQARALQQLGHWWALNPADAPALGNVVLRHSFATSFSFGTPQHVIDAVDEPIHFIIIPFVYTELLMLLAKALNSMLAGSEDGDAWAAMLSDEAADRVTVPPALKQLFARILSDHAFHPAEPGDNPTVSLKAQSDWLDYDEGDRVPGALETHLAYSALDFAIAHELGHRILHFMKPDTPSGPMLEEGADLIGIRLFAASWGWRDDILEGCPLSEGGRVLLGPIWFFYSAQLLFTLQELLGERTAAVAPEARLARARGKPAHHLSLIVDRWSRQKTVLNQYAEILGAFGAGISEQDGIVLGRLVVTLEAFSDALPDWVAQIPEDDIRYAAALRAI